MVLGVGKTPPHGNSSTWVVDFGERAIRCGAWSKGNGKDGVFDTYWATRDDLHDVHGVNGMDGMEAGVGSITWYTWVVKHADELYRTPILEVSVSVS